MLLKLEPEFDIKENKKCKIKIIMDCTIYIKTAKSYLLELYYLVS